MSADEHFSCCESPGVGSGSPSAASVYFAARFISLSSSTGNPNVKAGGMTMLQQAEKDGHKEIANLLRQADAKSVIPNAGAPIPPPSGAAGL